VCLAPVFQRPIAFALYRRILRSDFVVWNYIDLLQLRDEGRLVAMVEDDLDVPFVRHGALLRLHRPQKTGACAFFSASDER